MFVFLFLSCFIFFFGLVVGSFLNSSIYRFRVKEKEKVKAKRSFCPYCGHPLSWRDLIPLLSFFLLRRRCRYCQKPISWQYPLVELATGILFLLIFQHWQSSLFSQLTWQSSIIFPNLIPLFYLFIISSFLIVIFVYDLKYLIIPDKFIYSAIMIVVFYRLLEERESQYLNLKAEFWNLQPFILAFLSAFSAFLFFLTIFLISKGRWLGLGDVKLAFFLGLFLGFPYFLIALFFAFFIGAIIGIGLILFKKKELRSEVPFAPFLVLGTFIALFWGERIVTWYLNLF